MVGGRVVGASRGATVSVLEQLEAKLARLEEVERRVDALEARVSEVASHSAAAVRVILELAIRLWPRARGRAA